MGQSLPNYALNMGQVRRLFSHLRPENWPPLEVRTLAGRVPSAALDQSLASKACFVELHAPLLPDAFEIIQFIPMNGALEKKKSVYGVLEDILCVSFKYNHIEL